MNPTRVPVDHPAELTTTLLHLRAAVLTVPDVAELGQAAPVWAELLHLLRPRLPGGDVGEALFRELVAVGVRLRGCGEPLPGGTAVEALLLRSVLAQHRRQRLVAHLNEALELCRIWSRNEL